MELGSGRVSYYLSVYVSMVLETYRISRSHKDGSMNPFSISKYMENKERKEWE
jgi:hypothetical protein